MEITLMTCSWEDNIIINTPLIVYSGVECNSNFPHSIEIKPHDEYSLVANLQKTKNITECISCFNYSENVNLRMGLILIPTVSTYEYDSIMNDQSLWQIIWSNPIKLNKNLAVIETPTE